MTGEDLYNLWVEAMLNNGVEVDTWEQLDLDSQNAWDQVAAQIKFRSD